MKLCHSTVLLKKLSCSSCTDRVELVKTCAGDIFCVHDFRCCSKLCLLQKLVHCVVQKVFFEVCYKCYSFFPAAAATPLCLSWCCPFTQNYPFAWINGVYLCKICSFSSKRCLQGRSGDWARSIHNWPRQSTVHQHKRITFDTKSTNRNGRKGKKNCPAGLQPSLLERKGRKGIENASGCMHASHCSF